MTADPYTDPQLDELRRDRMPDANDDIDRLLATVDALKSRVSQEVKAHANSSAHLVQAIDRSEAAEAERDRLREAGDNMAEALRDCTPHYANGLPTMGQVIDALDRWSRTTRAALEGK